MGIWARSTWPDAEIVDVAGNHEFYRGERNVVLRLLREAAEETGVHFMNNDEIVIGDVTFLGATLWTDFNLFGVEQQAASMEAGMNGLKTKLIQESNLVKTVVVTQLKAF